MMTSITPTVTKEIIYNSDTRDYDCYVTIDDQREYIGSAPTYHDGECQCDEYTIRFYADAHTPEAAAALIMEEVEEEARHEQATADMGIPWSDDQAKVAAAELGISLDFGAQIRVLNECCMREGWTDADE